MIQPIESAPSYSVRSFARDCLFWLGVAYLLILVTVMTPKTYQLDDIKVSLLHTMGPVLTIVYLIFLAVGWVAPPRRALLWTLGGYLGVVTLSSIFAPAQARWSAWDGWWMQWALLGPFLAFMGGGGGVKQVRRVSAFVMLLALYGVLFGIGHCGLPGKPGLPELMRDSYGIEKIQKDYDAKYQEAENSTDTERRQTLVTSLRAMQQQMNDLRSGFTYKLVNTLASAKGTMMSFILNRDFFASFLLLTVPFAFVVLLTPAPSRGKALAWVLGIALAILFIADATTCDDHGNGYLAKMVPARGIQALLATAVSGLWFVVAGRWRRDYFWLSAMVIAFLLGYLVLLGAAIIATTTVLQVLFFVMLIPLAVAGYYLVASSVNQRIAGAAVLAMGLGCMAVGFHDGLPLAMLTAIVVLLAARAPGLIWRGLAVATLVGGAYCLLRTDSKVSMFLSLPVQMAVVAIVMLFPARLHLGARWRVIALGICVGLLFVTLGMISPAGKKIVAQFDAQAWQEHKDGFLNPMIARQIMWTGQIRIWLQHPILGASPKSYLIYFPLVRRPDYFLYEISHVTLSSHNFFADLLGETGILGFITFMSFLGVLYVSAIRRAMVAESREVRLMSAFLLAAMTGFLLENVFDVNARWPIGAGPYWAMLGVFAGFINRPVGALANPQDPGARAAENDEENPAVEAVWSPSPAQQATLWVVCFLCLGGAIYTTAYSVYFFAGSMANNEGLSLLGEPSPAEARGPILTEFERLQQDDRDLRKPGLSAADRKKFTTMREQDLRYYQECREKAMADFQAAIDYNPHFVTSYYKLASVQSMGDCLGNPDHDLADQKAALATYLKLQRYTPDFSQIRLNLGIINSHLARMTKDKKYEQDALENFRLAVRQTINISTQPHQSSETDMLCSALLPEAEDLHRPWKLEAADLPKKHEELAELATKLRNASDPVAALIVKRFPESARQALTEVRSTDKGDSALAAELASGLNAAMEGDCLYEEKAWARVKLTPRTLDRLANKSDEEEAGFLNRALVAQAFPDLVGWVPADEAAEAGARLRYAWTHLLVDKVPVRRSPGEVRDSIRRAAELETGVERDAGWPRQAERALRAVEALGLDDAAWLTNVESVFTSAHDDAGLAAFLEGYVERQPEVVQARLDLAVTLARLGRPREAERQALIVAGIDPTRNDVHYVLFDAARQAGDRAAAAREAALYLKAGKNNTWKRAIEGYLKQQPQG